MITTVTLNVSIDKAYLIDELKEGGANRVKSCTYTPGGKGLNVARVIKICGEEVLATGFSGGHAGAYVEEELNKEMVSNRFIPIKGETRSCINMISNNGISTEILEPGAPVDKEEIEKFLMEFPELIKESSVVTISGSVPQGVGTDVYGKLISIAKEKGKKVILDTSGELLKEGIKACPMMIKPNSHEMEALLGISIHNREEVIESAKKLQSAGIETVVVSLGSEGALVVTEDAVYHGKPPKIKAVNTVGCGDSMVAAFAVGFARGYEIEDTLKYAVAVSAANALTMKTGSFDQEEMESLREKVTVIRL